jgi:hypothetical protein
MRIALSLLPNLVAICFNFTPSAAQHYLVFFSSESCLAFPKAVWKAFFTEKMTPKNYFTLGTGCRLAVTSRKLLFCHAKALPS